VTKRTIIVAAAAIIGGFILINLLLHFGQKRHDKLGYDIDKAFPADKPFVPGEIFASVLAEIMEHELKSSFGWRPNDFFLWGPHVMADNNANRQLGIIMAVRESTRVFKDHLTKIPSNEYDKNLVTADTDFRNDAERWILPSPEGKYADGVAHLRAYVAGLRATPPTSRPINLRNAELGWLLQSWTDMLGDAHANLYRTQKDDGSPVEPWAVDDYFYHAQGVAYVMYHLMQAVKREYAGATKNKPVLGTLIDESLTPLLQAATLKPLIVLDGSPAGIVANHRKNLDAYISEARQKMFTLTDELAR
jgi:hypothetical protein